VDVSAFYGVLIVVTQAIIVTVYEVESEKSEKKAPGGEGFNIGIRPSGVLALLRNRTRCHLDVRVDDVGEPALDSVHVVGGNREVVVA
jgi:hypothetical protein